jgi:K+-sensing histidine kinase KdpD
VGLLYLWLYSRRSGVERVNSVSEQRVIEPPPDHPPSETPTDPDLRSGFLGFVAHEMRNPLSTALWSAELLARLAPEDRGGARGEKLSGMCLRALQRLRILVEDHFLAERLDVGGIPLRPENVPLRDVLDAIAAKARGGAPPVDLSGVAPDVAAWGDRGLIERVLDAAVAMAGRGDARVTVAASLEDGRVSLRVAGAEPAPEALAVPRKGTPSDQTGRALALHMAVRACAALDGSLTVKDGAYVMSLPAGPQGAEGP